MIVALRAPSLAKFGEVDTVPVSENSLKYTTAEKVSTEKVLGLEWNPEGDKLNMHTKEIHHQHENKNPERLTKRSVLSRVVRTFDPAGFASAFIIRTKIGLQDLWKRGLDWDNEITPDM